MILDAFDRFKTTGGSLDLATDGTTAVTSDEIDLATSGFADGKQEHILRVHCKTSTCAVGASVRVALTHCATEGGTYTEATAVDVPLASLVANTEIAALRLPLRLKQYVKVVLTPADSMTGALTANAALYVA